MFKAPVYKVEMIDQTPRKPCLELRIIFINNDTVFYNGNNTKLN